jgi:protease I
MLLDEAFEDSEFRVPYDRLRRAGHEVVIVGREAGRELAGKRGKERVTVEAAAGDVSVDDLDALVVPGGRSPDRLRTDAGIVGLVRAAFLRGKPVAAICHGPSLLAAADVADGRTVTSWPSIRTELVDAGARWVDQEVVEDGNLVTSRRPDDLEPFSRAILRQLEGRIPGPAPPRRGGRR